MKNVVMIPNIFEIPYRESNTDLRRRNQSLHTYAIGIDNIVHRRPIQDDRWDEGKIWQLLIPTGNPSPTDPTLLGVDAIKRLVSDGILPHRNCSLCNRPMALHQSTGYVDGCYWKCSYRNPKNKRPCKGPASSVRTGTLYERSRLSIPELSYSQMKEKMKIANNAAES
ncbi:hypothetical protein OUZ56_025366 [Daphnia magna]|uniref:Uncharacterized protein n=1 Tax=Daphnia magna TaxID=35525 RepID=A0ABQ9ZJM0_9CRUS|nr:hypothetical protein OUZ56_025366 [Daphnia magna]